MNDSRLDELFRPLARSDAPGLVVGVTLNNELVYRAAFGMASVELGVANTPATRMRIGSTSKHMTSLAALLLAEEGKLDLDAGLRRYVPEIRAVKGDPSLRQVMSHTSGIRDALDLGFFVEGFAIKPRGALLATQVRQSDVNFPPGEKMMYSNGGYHLLSLAIERAAGMPFEQFMKERIFEALGMLDTACAPSDLEIHPRFATQHVPLPSGGYRRGIFPAEEIRGEGSVISTIDDMLRWLAHLRGPKKVGSDRSWKQLTEPVRLKSGLIAAYSLGLMRQTYRGVDTIHHAGHVIGGSCQMLTVPGHALDVIIMTNATAGLNSNPPALALKIVDTLLADKLSNDPEKRAATERFKSMPGRRYYSRSSGMFHSFLDAGGMLALSSAGGPPVPLRDEGENLRVAFEDIAVGPFVVKAADLEADSAPSPLVIAESGLPESFELLPMKGPDLAQAGRALIGQYRCPDLDAEASIAFDGADLKLSVFGTYGKNVMVLETVADDVFAWKIPVAELPLTGVLTVERGAEGSVRCFRVDTLRTRHLEFIRMSN